MDTPTLHHRPEGIDHLREAQLRAARSAETVGSFVAGFRAEARGLIDDGRVDDGEADERLETLEAAAKGNERLRLADLDANVLGRAQVGGGDGGIELSREVFANAEDAADVERAQHVAAHEGAHAEQARLHGTLVVDGEEIDHLLLLEGHAELTGNDAVGKGMREHREGQPEETYAEGQRLAVEIIARVGRAEFESVLKGDGDVTRLQDPLETPEEERAVAA